MTDNNIKNIPNHVAIILDGNRRWAKEQGKPAFFGHRQGMENAKRIVTYAQKLGVKVITLWGFSTENWSRPEKEVNFLMKLFEKMIDKHLDYYHKQGVKFNHIGSLKELPLSLQNKIKNAIELTKNNKGSTANLALNYGGRDEIKRMIQKLIRQGVKAEDVTIDLINNNIDTAGLPEPDFIIRTSGEHRTSGFLIWQGVYSEWYFPKVAWPAFDEKEFDKAMVEYGKRQRRFGK